VRFINSSKLKLKSFNNYFFNFLFKFNSFVFYSKTSTPVDLIKSESLNKLKSNSKTSQSSKATREKDKEVKGRQVKKKKIISTNYNQLITNRFILLFIYFYAILFFYKVN